MKHSISQALHAKEQQGWEGASRCNPAQPISIPSSTALCPELLSLLTELGDGFYRPYADLGESNAALMQLVTLLVVENIGVFKVTAK